jgi:phage baseplate assembly protein W
MASFSFKSSGVTQADAVANELVVTATPIGIKTPVSLGNDDLVTTSTDIVAQLTDNLRNLILTNWGERLGFYQFGANLRPLMADLVNVDDFDSSAIERIKDAVGRWMPYIDLQDFISTSDRTQNKNTAVIQLTITFNIPSLKVNGKKLQVALYAI